MKKDKQISIGTLGLWHLGCVYAISFARMGFKVCGYDENRKTVYDLRKGILPISEPGLQETAKKYYGENLFFSSSVKDTLKNKDYIFITYDLPVDKLDRAQTAIIKRTFADIGRHISSHSVIVISSQVPIGTSRRLVNLLKKKKIKTPKVIYFPENLRLGNAVKNFLEPDRIILGSDNKESVEQFNKDFKFNCPVITMGLESAEMSKHALNSYLATCISFSSELSDLSERTGADMLDVVMALKTDRRVSPFAPLNPGLGFAGGTLGRDIQTLRKIARKKAYEPKLLNAVYSVNSDRLLTLFSKINSLYPNLKNKKIGILGLTYTPNTNTLRRSISLSLSSLLKNKQCQIKAFDPAVKQTIQQYPYIRICTSFEDFFQGLDLVILMTEWPEFRKIEVVKMSLLMNNKKFIDTKNFLDYKSYLNNGFTYLRIGVPN